MRRSLVAVVAVWAATVLAVSGAGFTSVEADRSAEVHVVSDQNAYLKLVEVQTLALPGGEVPLRSFGSVGQCVSPNASEVGNVPGLVTVCKELVKSNDLANQNTIAVSGSTATIFNVTNQFADDLTVVDATVTFDSFYDVTVVETPDHLTVGETGSIRAEISCDKTNDNVTVKFNVTVEGDTVEATRIEKQVKITCISV